jgi:peptide-methionine (S)-S-oxide reductase
MNITKNQVATFGAGCFWGVEDVFSKTLGVVSTMVGYSGGSPTFKNPTYKQVCTGKTGHVETVRVVFDPLNTTYKKLLDVFWSNHDPTTLNRQGPDVGSQYRSVIFYHDEAQKALAIASKENVQKRLSPRIVVTEIKKALEFYPAEEYHQKYFEKQKGSLSTR